MNTTSISLISAIILGLLAAIAVAFPVSANEGGIGVSLDADTSVSSDAAGSGASIGASIGAGATTSPSNVEDNDGATTLTILRGSLTADAGMAPATAATVTSESDLSAYATAALRADEQIDAVTFDEDAVEVTYTERGRLFAVVPVTMKARARVAADGSVTVSYPWYRFLVASDANTDVSSTLSTRASAWHARADAGASLSASEKAELMDEIRAALATSASVEATASVR